MIEATIRGADRLARDVKAETKRARYALNLAVRVEGFRLMRKLKKDIRDGSPGGRPFAPLSIIARRIYHRGRNEPLRRLALGVRYHVAKWDPIQMRIGWVGPRVSRRWKFLAKKLQEGFTTPVTPELRRRLVTYGVGLRIKKHRRYFFLKRGNRLLRTPARPIVDPFWRTNERAARRNIADNFRRKMRGQRI